MIVNEQKLEDYKGVDFIIFLSRIKYPKNPLNLYFIYYKGPYIIY